MKLPFKGKESVNFSRQGVRRTVNSFYECISLGLYGKTSSSGTIRKNIWDKISLKLFGCNVSELAISITSSETKMIPTGPYEAWSTQYGKAWVDLGDPGNAKGRCDEDYKRIFMKESNQINLAMYVISHATEIQIPDVDVIGSAICDCYNINLIIMETESVDRSPVKFYSPFKGKFGPDDWPKASRMCIHLILEKRYWDQLIEDRGGTFCVPKHVIHQISQEDLFDQAKNVSSPESFRMERGCVFQLRVFDASLRKNIKVGDFKSPNASCRVHILEIDCKNVKNSWIFTLWRPEMSRPGVKLSNDFLWIFSNTDNVAKYISSWKDELIEPRFLMQKGDSAIYAVESETFLEAVNYIKCELKMEVDGF